MTVELSPVIEVRDSPVKDVHEVEESDGGSDSSSGDGLPVSVTVVEVPAMDAGLELPVVTRPGAEVLPEYLLPADVDRESGEVLAILKTGPVLPEAASDGLSAHCRVSSSISVQSYAEYAHGGEGLESEDGVAPQAAREASRP
ncbi:hypothetical protein Dimus_029154 [Dionaea muscipula]